MKPFLFLTAASLISTLSADTPSPQNKPPIDCTLFNPKCRDVMVELYGECLFLQPNGTNLYWAGVAFPFDPNISHPAVSPNWTIHEIFPNYSPAFNIGITMQFTDLNTNLKANWQRLFSHKSANYTVPTPTGPEADMIGPISAIGVNDAAYSSGNAKAKFHFDGVNLVFGQQFCAFQRLYPNIYAGASFARIKQTMTTFYSSYDGLTTRQIHAYSTFTGAGPEVGFDFDYKIACSFFFTGNSSLGLIIGEQQNGTTFQSTAPILTGIIDPNKQATTVPNRTQVIPAIEERLGFSYIGLFKCFKLTFAAGYQAQIYINAVQSMDLTAPQALPNDAFATPVAGEYAVGYQRTLSNFMMTGPYIQLGFVF